MRYFEHAHTLIRHWRPPHGGRDGIRRFQARKLRSIVAHCRERVAVYRDHWRDADVASASIAAPEAGNRNALPLARAHRLLAEGSTVLAGARRIR